MKSKPMLFSAPMVRALLEGRKTQTRRIFKGTSEHKGSYNPAYLEMYRKSDGWGAIAPHPVGSEIWVKETWRTGSKLDDSSPRKIADRAVEAGFQPGCPIRYDADGHETVWGDNDRHDFGPWGRTRVSIHMPRWASRITLKVTEVRVQRLQDISGEDAIAEGILEDGAGWCGYKTAEVTGPWQRHAEDAYRNLWESINGPGSWDANPWVWAYTFEVKR